MRATRADSALISECAELNGVSIRAVQKWRKLDDARWRAFLNRRAQDAATQLSFAGASTPPPVVLTPEIEEENAARRYAVIDRLATEAAMGNEAARLPQLLKNATDAHNQLDRVRANNLAHKERTSRVIPVEKVRDLIQGNLSMAKYLLENLPDVLATRLDSPQDVAAITRIEVNAILRELSGSVAAAPWITAAPDDDAPAS